MPRVCVVLDTTVLISAATLGIQAGYVFELIKAGKLSHATSEEILTELAEKLVTKFRFEPEERDRFVRFVFHWSSIVVPASPDVPELRDLGDLHVLGTAVAAKANLIITTDRDLLSLKRYKRIGIVHPKTIGWMFK